MSKEKTEWENIASTYEKAIGRKPRKNMSVKTMKKQLESVPEKEAPDNPQITEKMAELMATAKECAGGESPTMISLVLGEKGIHMSMSGEGQDIAVMVATAICSEPKIAAVLMNGAMMAQMRMNNVAQEASLDGESNEVAPEGMSNAQTEA